MKARRYWFAITFLLVVAIGVGGLWWYEQAAVKYDRITNAKRV